MRSSKNIFIFKEGKETFGKYGLVGEDGLGKRPPCERGPTSNRSQHANTEYHDGELLLCRVSIMKK